MRTYSYTRDGETLGYRCDGLIPSPNEAQEFKLLVDIFTQPDCEPNRLNVEEIAKSKAAWAVFLGPNKCWEYYLVGQNQYKLRCEQLVLPLIYSKSQAEKLVDFLNENGLVPG